MTETLLQKAQRLGIKPANPPQQQAAATPAPAPQMVAPAASGETLLQKAQRLGIKPAGTPVQAPNPAAPAVAAPNGTETLLQKAQRLGIKPANAPTETSKPEKKGFDFVTPFEQFAMGNPIGALGNVALQLKNGGPDGTADKIKEGLKQDYSDAYQGVKDSVEGGAAKMESGFNKYDVMNPGPALADFGRGAAQAGLGTAGSFLGAVFAPVAEVAKAVVPHTGNRYIDAASEGAAMGAPGGLPGAAGGAVLNTAFTGVHDFQNYLLKNPKVADFVKNNPDVIPDFNHALNLITAGVGEKLGERKINGKESNILDTEVKNVPKQIGTNLENPGEIATKAATALGNRAAKVEIAPFKKSYNPGVDKAFQSEGIKAPISALTESPFLRLGEKVLSKGAFGQDITNQVNEATRGIEAKTNEIINKIKPSKTISDENLGKAIQEGVTSFKDANTKTKQGIVDQITPTRTRLTDEALGKLAQDDFKSSHQTFDQQQNEIFTKFNDQHNAATMKPVGSIERLNEIIRTQSLDPKTGVDSGMRRLLDDLMGETPQSKELAKAGAPESAVAQARIEPEITLEKLQEIKKNLGAEIAKHNNRYDKFLYGGIMQDIADGMNKYDPAEAARYSKITADFSAGKNALESNQSASVTSSDANNIPSNILSKNSAEAAATFKKRVSPETFDRYSEEFIHQILDKAKDSKGNIDVPKLNKVVANYDQPTIKAWLGKRYQGFVDTVNGLNQAHTAETTGQGKIQQEVVRSIEGKNPEQVAKNIIKRNSAQTLATVREMIGQDNFNEISQSFLRDQFEKADTRGHFDLEKFRDNLSKYDKETLNEVFTKEQQKNLDEAITALDKVRGMSEAMKPGQKIAEGSQTAPLQNITRVMGRMPLVGGAIMGGRFDIAAAIIMEIGSEKLATKMFTTEAGRKLLTKGYKPFERFGTPEKAVEAPKVPEVPKEAPAATPPKPPEAAPQRETVKPKEVGVKKPVQRYKQEYTRETAQQRRARILREEIRNKKDFEKNTPPF